MNWQYRGVVHQLMGLVIMALAMVGCSRSGNIEGSAPSTPQGQLVLVECTDGERAVDTVTVENGQFAFNMQNRPSGVYSISAPWGMMYPVYYNGSKLKMKIQPAHEGASVIEHGEYMEMLNQQYTLTRNLRLAMDSVNGMLATMRTTPSDNAQEFVDAINRKYAGAARMYHEGLLNLVEQYPQSPLSFYFCRSLTIGVAPDARVDTLVQRAYRQGVKDANLEAVMAEIKAEEAAAVGSRYLDLTVTTLQGDTVQLNPHVGNGHTVFLLFLSGDRWQNQDKESLDLIKKLYQEYKGKGLEVYPIFLDNTIPDWLAAEWGKSMPWAMYRPCEDAPHPAVVYRVRRVPYGILLSPEGYIMARGVTAKQLASHLGNLLQ